ncbi:permease [Desulfovibrio litoralis]|uniref:Permease n=1 Tax=Desulfovibrio litoralis DSM 11393 TaxID=1121455 RepID=A0A1M7S113_9BACT|nr:permease [Desulfovibrio litoralis]SHN52193.1 hypothetical protein SAMN02745728_00434 [Desulfovibrio litoralis DSM 11393]
MSETDKKEPDCCTSNNNKQDTQKESEVSSCHCACNTKNNTSTKKPFNTKKYFLTLLVLAVIWYAIYSNILQFANWLTLSVFKLVPDTHAAQSLEFFIYDTIKILLLIVAMVYVLAWVRVSLNVERVRDYLSGKSRVVGYFLGAMFGAVTPFCSCSSIPLFIGFTTARIPIGITMSFLITSPLVNEVAVVILWGLLGWKFTLVYVTIGMTVGIIGGFFMDAIKAERWLQPFLRDHINSTDTASHNGTNSPVKKISIAERHLFAYSETRDIFKRVWRWVIIGVGVGAILHGYVPESLIAETIGQKQWWSVPLSVMVGIPLYTNVHGMIPVMESMLLKGVPIGTTLALSMSTIAVSLPEIIMLKQVMRWKLLAIFIGMMLVIFSIVGWLFNAIDFIIL